MNETFSDSKSFIWRLPSPYNNKAFSFEAQLFLQSFVSLVQPEVQSQESQEYFHFSFAYAHNPPADCGCRRVYFIVGHRI